MSLRVESKLQAIALQQHILKESIPRTHEVVITPSEAKQSKNGDLFFELVDIFGFGRITMKDRIVISNETDVLGLDFVFEWENGKEEKDSYGPLMTHLNSHAISAICVADGKGLPNGLLFVQQLWTLKQNTSLRSEDLRKEGKESVLKFILKGRTDLVRTKKISDPLGNHNNLYFIEIKTKFSFKVEEALREAVLQLIGGNASNDRHSPPVLLTDLNSQHYVLFITQVGNPTVELKFELNVLKMKSFGAALSFVEKKTAKMVSVTMHFGRKPTPPGSPPKDKLDDESDELNEVFNNVKLEDVSDENVDFQSSPVRK